MKDKKIPVKQALFVKEYIVDFNATRAAIDSGYSKKTARSQGQRLLTNVDIQKAIAKAIEERTKRTEINSDYVLSRLVEIDEMDVADILDEECNLLPVLKWPKAWRRTVSGLDVSELWQGKGDDREQYGMIKKIKFPDKVKNLELLGRHVDIQAWNDKQEFSGDMTVRNLIAEISKEAGDSEEDSPLPKDNV